MFKELVHNGEPVGKDKVAEAVSFLTNGTFQKDDFLPRDEIILKHASGLIVYADREELVRPDGSKVDLYTQEIAVLVLLLANSGAMVTEGRMIAAIGRERIDECAKQHLQVIVSGIRSKLEDKFSCIINTPNIGYCFAWKACEDEERLSLVQPDPPALLKMTYDRERKRIMKAQGEERYLDPRTVEIMEILVAFPGKVIPYGYFLRVLGVEQGIGGIELLRGCVHDLRKKIDAGCISTLYRIGYRLNGSVEIAGEDNPQV